MGWLVVLALIVVIVIIAARGLARNTGIDSDLQQVLAQVGELESYMPEKSTWHRFPDWADDVLRNTDEWNITMTFGRVTNDGKICTMVRVAKTPDGERAIVNVSLTRNTDESRSLASFKYFDGASHTTRSQTAMVHIAYVRRWIRRLIVPQLETAETLRQAESRSQAAAKARHDAEQQENQRKNVRKYFQ